MDGLEKQRKDSKQFVKHAMEIAMLLGKLRDERGWSNSKFAEMIGVNESEVSKWLAGTQNFTIRTIAKIENALDIDIIRQFSDEELGIVEFEETVTQSSQSAVSNSMPKILYVDFRGTETKSKTSKQGDDQYTLAKDDALILMEA